MMSIFCLSILLSFLNIHGLQSHATNNVNIFDKRMALYATTESLSLIPWYYVAAIEPYERQSNETLADDQLISIQLPTDPWFGIENISPRTDERVIGLFAGARKDGNAEG